MEISCLRSFCERLEVLYIIDFSSFAIFHELSIMCNGVVILKLDHWIGIDLNLR